MSRLEGSNSRLGEICRSTSGLGSCGRNNDRLQRNKTISCAMIPGKSSCPGAWTRLDARRPVSGASGEWKSICYGRENLTGVGENVMGIEGQSTWGYFSVLRAFSIGLRKGRVDLHGSIDSLQVSVHNVGLSEMTVSST